MMMQEDGGGRSSMTSGVDAFLANVGRAAPWGKAVSGWMPVDANLRALFKYIVRKCPRNTPLIDIHRFLYAWVCFVLAETDAARLDAARVIVSFPPFISPYFCRPAVTRAVRALPEYDRNGRDRRAQVNEWLAHALCDVWEEEACRPGRLRLGERGSYVKAAGGGWTRSGPDQPAVPVPKGTIIPVMPVFRLDVVGLYRFLRHRTKRRAADYLLKVTGYAPKEIGKRDRAALALASQGATTEEAQAFEVSAEARAETEERLRRLLALVPADKRELVALRAAGVPYRDIAARLGYPAPGAARTAMCRVRKDLRRAGGSV
jgi:hypothetical protein